MIQSSYKPIELPKASAPERAKPSSRPKDLESKLEKEDFKSELKAVTHSDEHEPKVKEVKVSADKALRKPSSLINEKAEVADPDSVSPKVFDPAMTKDVQELIGPETTQAPVEMTDEMILKLAQGEAVTDADLAVDLKTQLAKIEGQVEGEAQVAVAADPELLKMEDFVAQKNMVNKKILPQNAYGMNPQANKLALENGLKDTQVVKDITASESGAQPMNSQQFILNMQAEQKPSGATHEVTAPVKTFDLSQIKTSNPEKIMNQISDYIVQAKASKEPTVSMRVNHEQLGMIDITVAKTMHSDAVAINIGAHSMDGKNFFQQNSKDLFSHLSNAGITVADMKVEIPSQTAKNDFDMSQHNRGNQHDRQFGSEQNQRRQDSQRREDLWKLLNKEAA